MSLFPAGRRSLRVATTGLSADSVFLKSMRAVVARISNHLLLLSMRTFISCSVRPKCLPSSFAMTDNFMGVPVRTRCFRRCCLTRSEPGHGHDSCHLLCLLDFDGGAPLATFLLISLEALPGRTIEMACRNEVIGNFTVEFNLILLQSCIKQSIVIGKLLTGLARWQDHAKKARTDNLSNFMRMARGIWLKGAGFAESLANRP